MACEKDFFSKYAFEKRLGFDYATARM
jgi:hypothetical protein